MPTNSSVTAAPPASFESGAKPSSALAAAALCGLLVVGVAAGCAEGTDSGVAPTPSASGSGGSGGSAANPDAGQPAAGEGGVPGTYDHVISEGTPVSAEDFKAMCDERNGWMYVTAFCAGSGLCKGLSLLDDTVTDHSCKGMNSCGGAGCVVLPEDSGLSGQEIYQAGPCGNCHGDWSDSDNPRFDVYMVNYGPDTTAAAALKQFKESTDQRLTSIVVFGTQGMHPDGTPYSNMPAYYQKYSLAEIQRTIAYLKTLQIETQEYEIFGVTPGDGIPGAGGAAGAGGGG